jgi:hypothetical protein
MQKTDKKELQKSGIVQKNEKSSADAKGNTALCTSALLNR